MVSNVTLGKVKEVLVKDEPTVVDVATRSAGREELQLPPLDRLRSANSLADVASFRVRRSDPKIDWEWSAIEYERLKDTEKETGPSATLYSKISSFARLAGKYDEAIEYKRRAIEIRESQKFRYELAEMQLAQAPDERIWREMMSLSKEGFGLARLRLIQRSLSEGEVYKAWQDLKEFVAEWPDSWEGHLLLGTLELLQNRYQGAIREFRETLQLRGNLASAYTLLAVAHVRQGNEKHVIGDLRKAIGLNPLNRTAVMAFSDLSVSCPTIRGLAETYLQFFIEHSIDVGSALDRLGRLYYLEKMPKKGIASLLKLPVHEITATTLNNCGVLYWELGESRKALEYFYKASKHDKGDARSQLLSVVNAASLLIAERQNKEAIELLSRKVEEGEIEELAQDSKGYKLLSLFVRAQLNEGEFSEGIRFAGRILDLENVKPELQAEIAAILSSHYSLVAVDLKAAIDMAEYAFNICEKNDIDEELKRKIVNNYAFVLLEAGMVDDAKSVLTQLQDYEGDPYALATRGLYHIRSGNVEKGKEYYRLGEGLIKERQVKKFFEQKLQLEIGRYWAKLGKKWRARRAFEKARKIRNAGFAFPVVTFQRQAGDELQKLSHNK